MQPDGVRTSVRYAPSSFPGDGYGRIPRDSNANAHRTNANRANANMANGNDFYPHVNDDDGPRPSSRPQRQSSRRAPPPPPPGPSQAPPPPPRREPRSLTATGSAPESSAAVFLGRNHFHCPELDQRMKKYLVRLANETANHLIRDTREPDHANLLWRPMATVKGIEILRGYEKSHRLHVHNTKDPGTPNTTTSNATNNAPLKDATCLRGVAQVSASIEEFAMLFKLDTNRQLAEHGLLFNPDLLDMATLYSLVQPSGDHPRRYVGIKWCLVQSPSRLFRNRDFCYLECQKEFRDANGRRGWVRSMHSIKMPCCPSLEKPHGIVRASLYRCGLIAVETDKPGVLDTTYTIEMDLKGHFPEIFQPKFLSQRIAALASIDKYLQQQRLSSSPLLGDLDIPKTKIKGTCHFCFREFAKFARRFVCRKCGECVCKNCSSDWQLDVPVVGSMKVRICTVCSAEARACHATPAHKVAFNLPHDTSSSDDDSDPRRRGGGRARQDLYHYRPHRTGRIRRSNSMPEHDEYGESPFQQTAEEPLSERSLIRSAGSAEPLYSDRSNLMEPSAYFALQQLKYEQQLREQQQQFPPPRESQALYRESDFTSEIRDFTHGEIRGTADLTNLWTQHDAEMLGGPVPSISYQQPRGEPSIGRGRVASRRTPESNSPNGNGFRVRIPSDVSGRSVFRESGDLAASDVNHTLEGNFPPSARYAVVDDHLERANSFDAARQYEERLHQQQNNQRPRPVGNSRQSPRPLGGMYSSPAAPTPIYQYHGQQSHSPQSARQQQAPPAAPSAPQANIALAFARQPQQSQPAPAPRNIALEFARQPSSTSGSNNTTPRNVALDFVKQPPPQPTHNVALAFLAQQQISHPPLAGSPESPTSFQSAAAKVRWSQMVDTQPEPPRSPDAVSSGDPIEYVETASGEWIASDRWAKGALLAGSILDVDGEPIVTRACRTCGATQYVHEGVVEASCDCDDDDLTRPSTQTGQSSRDESRVSFRVETDMFETSESFIDPLRVQMDSFHERSGSEAVSDSPDVDTVLPQLVDQSIRSSFHHT